MNMKKILYSLVLFTSVLSLISCGSDELTDSRITQYVTISLKAGQIYTLPVGTTYQDPGFTATQGTSDVTSSVKVDGTVDGLKVGYYPVIYSAVNPDGFSNSVTRMVFVYNPKVTVDLSGVYKIQTGSYRNYGGTITRFNDQDVTLTQVAAGVFSISDWFGGYYDKFKGYGSSYAMSGYMSLGTDNSISGLYGLVSSWGDSYDSVSGSYDPVTGTITLDVAYAGKMTFHLILNK